jgi:hypothetical protein
VSASTADPKVIQIAKDWIAECSNGHERCRRQHGDNWHPSRLLDLYDMLNGGRVTEKVRLVSTKKAEMRPGQPQFQGRYITLSHRWGGKEFYKLKEDRVSRLLDGVPFTELPRTFQDVIKVACELQVRWLWCVVPCLRVDAANPTGSTLFALSKTKKNSTTGLKNLLRWRTYMLNHTATSQRLLPRTALQASSGNVTSVRSG